MRSQCQPCTSTGQNKQVYVQVYHNPTNLFESETETPKHDTQAIKHNVWWSTSNLIQDIDDRLYIVDKGAKVARTALRQARWPIPQTG
jgi:hypothetical protein